MDVLTPAEAARLLGVSPNTLRTWADMGLLVAQTTPRGHRRYQAADVERLRHTQPRQAATGPSRILIVDDDALFADLLREEILALQPSLKIDLAHDGFEAGRKLVTTFPDIVLLDLTMPGMDGFQVCQTIKRDAATAGVRVIAMTGDPTRNRLKRIVDLGAEICLVKPIDKTQLAATLGLTESMHASAP